MTDETSTQRHTDPIINSGPLHGGAFAFTADFPTLRTIEDVRPFIRPDEGIKAHVWAEDFIGVNYAVTMPETFQTALDLECRGLVFDRHTGTLLSRPLHKMFQLGERQSIADLDFGQANWVEQKLDGSMIAGLVADGEVRLHTRGGFSRQARQAQDAAPAATIAFVREVVAEGHTPIFEWTSPDNRVVIKYHESRLTLLALRHRETGRYLPRADMEAWARRHGVPVAPIHTMSLAGADDLASLVADVRALTGEEGVVLAFADGHRVKIKATDYLRNHKIISDIASEKNAQKAWIDDAIDDIAAILDDHRGQALRYFGADMDLAMLAAISKIEHTLTRTAPLSPRDRAAEIQASLPKPLASAAFAIAKGQDPLDQMRRILTWGHRSLDNMRVVRQTFDLPRWTPE